MERMKADGEQDERLDNESPASAEEKMEEGRSEILRLKYYRTRTPILRTL